MESEVQLSSYWPNPVCFPIIELLKISEDKRLYLKCILFYHYDKRRSLNLLVSLSQEYQNKAQVYMYQKDESCVEHMRLKEELSKAILKYDLTTIKIIFEKCSNTWDFRSLQYRIYSGCYMIILYYYIDRQKIEETLKSILPCLRFQTVWKAFSGLVYYSLYICDGNPEWIAKIPSKFSDFKSIVNCYNSDEYPVVYKENLLKFYVQSLRIQNITEKKKILLPCLKGDILLKLLSLIELYKIYQFDEIGVKIKLQIKVICQKHRFAEIERQFDNNLFSKLRLF